MTGEDEIHQPLLRLRDVMLRGVLYGLAAIPLVGIGSLGVSDHHARMTFLAVIAGFAMIGGGVFTVTGLGFWAACGGDIRRCRDWRTIKGQTESVTVAAPVLLRLGMLALALFPGAFGLYHLVDNADYDSLIHGS
ncbi:DUF6336 family protein [Streptomyces coffeae]|uniref:DUF6336 family protein n=1 Tax=Streptomyces coffeae TaxID=621382 RepID=UPI001C07B146|nr:DUF6336 family protein [Streptomyces coffeae]